ncbi:MAG: AtpZ/AtpI family protein [Saprospiraceae bacterium]|nr:AtpZ/AtpI family protein [Saprospiraceae bacterium]MDW8484332.1 AtpZ/AtpI family protein [Saprospiraceae bacterium]
MSSEKPWGQERKPKRSPLLEWMRYSGIAFELLGACLAGMLVGRWMDTWLELEQPTWSVVLTVLFMIAAVVSLYRKLK